MSRGNVDGGDDATRLSDEQVLDLFRVAVASTPDLGVADFFDLHPGIACDRYLVPTIVADIRRTDKEGSGRSPRHYFKQFDSLASNPDAWKILDAAEPWLIANEGSGWADAWAKDFPDVARRFVKSSPSDQSPSNANDDVQLDDLRPGDCVLDFQILRFIGKGAFGRVYLANDLSLDRQCALKVTVDQGSEGRVLARLNHPGIVHVYREHSLRGKKLLSMQFVDGQSLSDWIRGIGVATVSAASIAVGDHVTQGVRLVRDVATSLKHAHGRGVLHRDIKPANILIDKSGQPMLSDFNVATSSDRSERFSVGGTINYMSPEQLQAVCLNDKAAEERVDIRSDVYSLGVVLLETITGQKAWPTANAKGSDAAANQVLAARIRSGPPSIAGLPGVTPALAAIVDKALRPNAEDRYQSAAELETDLTDWIENRNNTYAANPSFVERTTRRIRRHGYWWGGGAIASVLLVAIAAYGYVDDRRQLERCFELAKETEAQLNDRRYTRASESLGQAKAQLQQINLASWVHSDRYDEVIQSLSKSSRRIAIQEAERFSSLFGEISLRKVHQNTPSDLADLIEDGLRAYKVMTADDWQHQSPFVDLPPLEKASVAEGITELILVSMHQSARQNKPTKEQVQQVLNRLPKQHQHFSLFKTISEKRTVATRSYDATTTMEPFEAYLYGVVATMEREPEDAVRWFSRALRNHEPNQPERFWCHYRHAYLCQELKRREEAFIHYGICLGLQPNFAWPKFNMGLACLDIGHPELAELYIQQAIQVDPKFTAAYVALIAIQTQTGKYDEAAATYKEANSQGVSSPELTQNFNISKKQN